MLLYVCNVLECKRMKFKTNLVFRMCLVVTCGFMESIKDMAVNKFKKPNIISGVKVCLNFLVY